MVLKNACNCRMQEGPLIQSDGLGGNCGCEDTSRGVFRGICQFLGIPRAGVERQSVTWSESFSNQASAQNIIAVHIHLTCLLLTCPSGQSRNLGIFHVF